MSKLCELCKTENEDENLFCEKCGNPLKEPTKEEFDDEEKKIIERQTKKLKMALIPTILVIILAIGVMVYMNIQSRKTKTNAQQVVTNYLNEVKNGNYAKALKDATGKEINEEWEREFKEFMVQLTPPMPINDDLQKAKECMAQVNEKIDRYYYLNKNYPSALNELTPVIMPSLPALPGGGEFGYEKDDASGNYTLYVKGDAFKELGLPENFPAYSKTDRMQSPGEKKLLGEWKINNFEIKEVKDLGKTIKVTVVETDQFGPNEVKEEVVFSVIKQDNTYLIDVGSTKLDLSTAFSQMEDINGPKEPVPEPTEEDKKGKDDKKGKKGKKGKETPEPAPVKKRDPIRLSLGMTLLAYVEVVEDPQNLVLRKQFQVRKCKEALELIAQAEDRFSRDNGGVYTRSLMWLVPTYLSKIPDNPVTMSPDFCNGYEVTDSQDAYTVYAPGSSYKKAGLEENYPKYSSRFHRLLASPQELEACKLAVPAPEPLVEPSVSPTPGTTPEPGASPAPAPGATGSPAPAASGSPAPAGSAAPSPAVSGSPAAASPSPDVSPKASPAASPKASPAGSPGASPKAAPAASPKASPAATEKKP